ncbi:YxeA family protein [Neobacillus thermocopriae]|uniref:YxeA family protein n=1 Tax=Neobacillus thermocopriae TaxID=1215031 RepID=A0A6B3TQU0_9BACI|nr:YxeA family protein [Neobacillus thermocopriae]MED3624450.1 YxeA family protein [Neobacillus thermocopriae]MED3714841.1 YxeA family protein [Neobacillus thermocopriae]NEX78719.1 YxeA family protein [Neobacillus thermocopriae]
MKKLALVFLLFVVLLISIFTVVPKEDRDHMNPFVPKEEVYVKINEDAISKGGRYEYTLSGFNKVGEEREITFDSGKILKQNAILKISVKGAFVEKWEEVKAKDLPEKVKVKLN